MSDYFREVSYGQYLVEGDVIGTSGGVVVKNQEIVAHVRLPNPKSYYTDNNYGVSVNNFPHNLAGVYRDALVALLAKQFDFSPYISPQTNEVSHTIVIFPGQSSRSGPSTSNFQASAYKLEYYYPGGYQQGGVTFNNFTFCPELGIDGNPSPLGVCAHEHGHMLGLPDLYDLSEQTSGIGYYDIMSYGPYADGAGNRPSHFGAWSKEQLGWAAPVTLLPGQAASAFLPDSALQPAVIKVPINQSEYYLIENRQFGGFDASLSSRKLCPGVLIWHIDQFVVSQNQPKGTVNSYESGNPKSHFGVRIVEADGLAKLASVPRNFGACSDTWQAARQFSASSIPASVSWSGAVVPLVLDIASVASQVAALKFSGGGKIVLGQETTSGAIPSPTATAIPASPSISANVKNKSIRGRLSSATSPLILESQAVELLRIKKRGSKLYATTQTKRGGSFAFKKLKAGKYQVRILGFVTPVLKIP